MGHNRPPDQLTELGPGQPLLNVNQEEGLITEPPQLALIPYQLEIAGRAYSGCMTAGVFRRFLSEKGEAKGLLAYNAYNEKEGRTGRSFSDSCNSTTSYSFSSSCRRH